MPVTLLAARERADLQRPVGVALELARRAAPTSMCPSASSGIDDDVGDRLAPRQLVGVVLERADEHDRALARRDLRRQLRSASSRSAGMPQAEDADQLVDRAGRARSRRRCTHVVVVAADGVADDPAGVLAQPGGLQAGAAGLGVGVGVAGQHLVADEVLDERQRAPAGGVVGVGDPARAVRAGHHLVVADHATRGSGAAAAARRARAGVAGLGHAATVAPRVPSSGQPYERPAVPPWAA